jgi:hypothetical protein
MKKMATTSKRDVAERTARIIIRGDDKVAQVVKAPV